MSIFVKSIYFLLGRIVVYIWLQWYCYRISIHDIYRKISTARCSWTATLHGYGRVRLEFVHILSICMTRKPSMSCIAIAFGPRCRQRLHYSCTKHKWVHRFRLRLSYYQTEHRFYWIGPTKSNRTRLGSEDRSMAALKGHCRLEISVFVSLW